jgi:hypothetical protein
LWTFVFSHLLRQNRRAFKNFPGRKALYKQPSFTSENFAIRKNKYRGIYLSKQAVEKRMVDLATQLKLPKQRTHIHDVGFFKRLLAFLVDLLLLDFLIFTSFDDVIGNPQFTQLLNGMDPSLYATGMMLMLLAFTYFLLFEYLLNQTPGMMLLNIEADNVTFWRAVVRSLYLIPVFPFPLLWVAEPFYLPLQKTTAPGTTLRNQNNSENQVLR